MRLTSVTGGTGRRWPRSGAWWSAGYLRLIAFSLCGVTVPLAFVLGGCGETSVASDDGELCFVFDPMALQPPDGTRPCLHNGECEETEYCYSPNCKGEGWCMERPQGCADIYSPVCGCNGFSNGNFCYAASRGVRTARCGECPPCANNNDCATDQFCNAFGDCSGPGHCGVRPEYCPNTVEPVCGCNGVSYDNECLAWAAGVRVATRGMCECVTSEDCGAEEYCTGESCDAPGTCESVSAVCETGFRMPICGCDNATYSTECAAARAGVRRDAFAACGTY